MAVAGAVWCVVCGAMPDVALTIERRGVLAHYGACWAHVLPVAIRARADTAAADQRALGGAVAGAGHLDAIEVQGDGPRP